MHSNTMMMECVLVAIVGSASPGLSQEAVLSTDRTSYLQHEPVELRIDYINRSTTPLTTQLDPVWLSVSQPGGVPRRVGLWQDRLSEVDDRSPARATIQPGDTYRRIIWVALDRTQAWVFPSIGRWQVGVESLRAVPIEIEIVEPDGGEVAKAALLFGPKACASFLSNGNDVEGSASTLQDIVDKYPRTTFASFAAWSLVQNQWAHHAPADIDWTKERAWVSVILQGPQDHPLRPAAMYAVVRYHQFQKSHKDQARKAADDLARAYPWSTWAHAVRRDFGQDVSAKLVPYSEDPAVKRRREASEKRSDTSPAEKPPAGSHSSKASPMPARTAADSLDSIVPPQWKPKKAGTVVIHALPTEADQSISTFARQYFETVATGDLRAAAAMLADDYVSDRGNAQATLARWRWFADRRELPKTIVTFKSITPVEKYSRPATPRTAAKEWKEPLWLIAANVTQEPTATSNGNQAQVTLAVRKRGDRLEVLSETYHTSTIDLEKAVLSLFQSLRERPSTTELQRDGHRLTLPQLLAKSLGPDVKDNQVIITIEGWRWEAMNGRKCAVIHGRAGRAGEAIPHDVEFGLVFHLQQQEMVLEDVQVPAKDGGRVRAQ